MIRMSVSVKRRNSFGRLCRGNHRVNFELHQVIPIENPFVQVFTIISFHQLKASFEFFVDPARYVSQAFRSETSVFLEASIHGYRILVLKVLNNHVEQISFLLNVGPSWFAHRGQSKLHEPGNKSEEVTRGPLRKEAIQYQPLQGVTSD
jgi:hypothetical protein